MEGYLNIIPEKQADNSVDDYMVFLERCIERLREMIASSRPDRRQRL
ncbi:MAG: hypothetical protein IPI74_00550 [Bacteroidales bacterium]|nr:hypothetical protein [Bacteroidales bacterium]